MSSDSQEQDNFSVQVLHVFQTFTLVRGIHQFVDQGLISIHVFIYMMIKIKFVMKDNKKKCISLSVTSVYMLSLT